MKPFKMLPAALLLLLPLSVVHAESSNAPAAPEKPMNMPQGMGMHHGMGGMGGMMGGMGNMSEQERDQHLRMKQEHMLKLHDLSNRILAETDPKKKEALKNEQLELMKAHHMQMMQMMPHPMGGMQMPHKMGTPPAKAGN